MHVTDQLAVTRARQQKSQRICLGGLLFVSGALALVYEMLWFRQFSFFFGSAASASSAILAAYFAGLGMGSYYGGKWTKRWPNPWLTYGILEVCIGISALGVGPILALFSSAHAQWVGAGDSSPEALLLLKGLLAFAAIAVPTLAMGATLPVLAELVDAGKEQPGRRVGWLYVMNTVGGAVGALSFPFLLLPALGMRTTTLFCALLNLAVGAAAMTLSRASGWPLPTRELSRSKRRHPSLPAPLALAMLSGAGTFALQVLWNRAFAQVHENSLTSFALIVAIFILAIASGAELARRLLERNYNLQKVFACAWMAGGLLVLISPMMILWTTNQLAYLPPSPVHFRLLGMSIAVIVPPVVALSCGMPLLFQAAVQDSKRSAGERTGAILAANVVGSITGALLAGFVFPKTLGMWNGMLSVGLLYLGVAAWILWLSWNRRLVLLSVLAFVGWLLFSQDWPRTRIDTKGDERLVALTEGAHGIVAVTERPGSRRLKLNNHYVLGGTSSIGDERMQAHLPLLVHPAPQHVAFLGLGTGISAGGARFHPGVESTGVELVPEVGQFASQYFAEANLGFGTAEGTSLVIADARDYLRGANGQFDVLIGDLVVPWRPGEASLYTREHFRAAKSALRENGLLCVWVPLFQLRPSQFQIILNTFLGEFDQALAWRGDFSPMQPALALMAFKAGSLDPNGISERLTLLRPDPANPQLRFPAAFWMHLIGEVRLNGSGLAQSREVRIHSEDRPWLELPDESTSQDSARYFVGRDLQRWETQVRQASLPTLSSKLPPEALRAYEAGAWMREFTLALQEGRRSEARRAERRIRELVETALARTLFGPSEPDSLGPGR